MDVTDITPRLAELDGNLDKLEEALKPLVGDLSDLSSKLPLLDKAKLNVLTAYALESLLFSSLRVNGADAKDHAVFTELTRVRQYFEKIKKIETPEVPRETQVDTQAAIRFIRADLADNKDVKKKLSEQLAKEKAKAALNAARAAKRAAEEGASSQSADAKGGNAESEGSQTKRRKH